MEYILDIRVVVDGNPEALKKEAGVEHLDCHVRVGIHRWLKNQGFHVKEIDVEVT